MAPLKETFRDSLFLDSIFLVTDKETLARSSNVVSYSCRGTQARWSEVDMKR
jgi:hypothetical protein